MSTPQFSIVLYVKKDVISLQRFLMDSHNFFAKFQIPFQVVVATSTPDKLTLKNLQKIALPDAKTPPTKIKILRAARGRAETLWQTLLDETLTDLVLLADLSLSTPFADLLKLLQELMQDPELAAVYGDRLRHKSKPLSNQKSNRISLERLFTPIILEKDKIKDSTDPLCEVGALRLSKLDLKALKTNPSTSTWYFHRTLTKALIAIEEELQRKIVNLPITDAGQTSSDFSKVKEIWNLSFY